MTSTTASIPGPVARSLLKVCAAVFLMLMAAYSAAIIYCMRHPFPTADLGATYAYEDAERAVRIDMTVSAGAADRAGLRTGDRIVSVNGVPLATPYPFWNALEQGRPTDTVRLGVQRGGAARTSDVHVRLDPPLELPARIGGTMLTPTHVAALEVLSFYPIPFIVVAGVVLIQRYHDRNAWLLAVMFAGFVVGERPRVWCAPGPPGGTCPIPPHSCRRAEAEAVAAERQQGPAELA